MEERPDGSRRENHDRGVVICRDIKEVQAMFESNNIIKGQKVTSQIEKEKEEEEREKEAEVKIFKVPSEVYQDFEELDEANEDMFEVVSYSLIIQFLEHICLKIKQDSKISEKNVDIIDFKKIKFNVKASLQKEEYAKKKKADKEKAK